MTVGELIEKLSAYPADANVYIEDADTEWLFAKFNVTQGGGRKPRPGKPNAVFLWIESYDDREEDE